VTESCACVCGYQQCKRSRENPTVKAVEEPKPLNKIDEPTFELIEESTIEDIGDDDGWALKMLEI
jgi:hypothetical protein